MTRASAAILLACLLVPASLNAQDRADAGVTEPGIYQLTLPESERRYTLSIPDGYSGQVPAPLIVSLHYGGRVTPFYGRGLLQSLIEPALRELRAIIVAPDSAAGSWSNPTSEQHVLELMDHIEARYNIDENKTLLTGYSMGADGTWYLVPRHPERFRAGLVMAGEPQPDSTTFDWQTPMYLIQGAADDVKPPVPTERAVERLRSKGASVELVVLDGVTHYEIPRYRSYLTAAIPWIREAWAR